MIAERRSEKRESAETLNSVIVQITSIPVHQFKLKDISQNGNYFIVKEDSAMLRNLKMGKILKVRYQYTDVSKSTKLHLSVVRHITKADYERFKGHYLNGVIITKELSIE